MSIPRYIRGVLSFIEPYDPGLFPEDLTERYGIPEERIINLGSNENPHPFPQRLVRETLKRLPHLNRYPNPAYKKLKESIADYVGYPPEQIAIGNGASDLIDIVCKIALNPLDKVVMPVPTYTLYMLTSMIRDASLQYVETQDSNFKVTWEAMSQHLKHARLAILGSPNNPTGLTVGNDQLTEMMKIGDTLFAIDETYSEFSKKTAADLLPDHPSLIIIRSLSKYYSLAGVRVGYALACPELVEILEKARLPFTVNSFAVIAALSALENRTYFRRLAETIISERNRLRDELDKMGLKPYPSEANFLLVELNGRITADQFTEQMAHRGVIIRNLKNLLGLTGEFVRVTVGTRRENRIFIQACNKILEDANDGYIP